MTEKLKHRARIAASIQRRTFAYAKKLAVGQATACRWRNRRFK